MSNFILYSVLCIEESFGILTRLMYIYTRVTRESNPDLALYMSVVITYMRYPHQIRVLTAVAQVVCSCTAFLWIRARAEVISRADKDSY